jgi:pimeloyl-ACP methyl ester carboxylesterase
MKNVMLGLILAVTALGRAAAAEPWQTVPSPPSMPHPSRSGYARVNGTRMYYAVFGHGSPILLIHLGEGNADQWSGEVPILARRHTVIIADTRGHGRSAWDGRPLSYQLLASDYLALLDRLHFKRVALAGVSDGAIIGLQIAIAHPDRLTSLFAQGANATPDAPYPKAADPAASKAASALNATEYRRLSPTPNNFAQFHAALDRMWSNEPRFSKAQLASIRTPTAIVMSDHDEWIPPEHARYLAATIPHAHLVVLHNVSHYAALQAPRAYAAAILSFVDSPLGKSRKR